MMPMTTTDYLINVAFVVLVLRQTRAHELDRRSWLLPLGVLAYVAHLYVHTVPSSGNDLVLVGALGAVGLTLGVASGLATHVEAGTGRYAVARVGWAAGTLLIAGFGARMVFELAVNSGARQSIVNFSITNHLSAAAWPTALVLMALLEIGVRIAIVQLRGHRAMAPVPQRGRAVLTSAVS